MGSNMTARCGEGIPSLADFRRNVSKSFIDGMTVEQTSSYSSEKKRSKCGRNTCSAFSALCQTGDSSASDSSILTTSTTDVLTSFATVSAKSISYCGLFTAARGG